MSELPSVTKTILKGDNDLCDMFLYQLLNRMMLGHMFVRTKRYEKPQAGTMIELIFHTDYGNYAYTWPYASGDWREWLIHTNFSYAMEKLAGKHFLVPMSIEKSCQEVRKWVIDQRRQGDIDRDVARTLWDAADADDFNGNRHSFFEQLVDKSGGEAYRQELYDLRFTEPSAECRGFWDNIWLPLMGYLKNEIAAETASATDAPQERTGE